MKRKIFSVLFALVLALSLSLVTAVLVAVSANGTTFAGSTISVESQHLCNLGEETEEAFDAEPETLVLDGVSVDAQTSPVIIEGEVSNLFLGAGWVDTAYLEIGLRPEATDARNAGVYLIAYNAYEGAGTEIHLQDYTGMGFALGRITLPAINSDFRYKITLEPSGNIGGKATLEVWVDGTSQGTLSDFVYGYASTWEENVAGALDEDFSSAHLFYSIIADRRGVEGQTYSATVGGITIDDTLYVGDEGQEFTTIQAAINAAVPGHTITVAAGTYKEAVFIDKSLTLNGAKPGQDARTRNTSSGESILDGADVALDVGEGAFNIADGVSNVIIDGFEVCNYSGSSNPGNGTAFMAYCYDTQTEGRSNITIQNNYMHDLGWNGILVWSNNEVVQEGFTIQFNLIEEAPYAGIELTNVTNSQVLNNKVIAPTVIADDPGDAGVGIEIAVRAQPGFTITAGTNVLVEGNEISGVFAEGSRAGINLLSRTYAVDADATLSGVTVRGNIVSGGGANLRAAILAVAESRSNGPATITNLLIDEDNILDGNHDGIVVEQVGGGTHESLAILDNTITDFTKGGIVVKDVLSVQIELNIISTTVHSAAPNGIQIGYVMDPTATTGTVKDNQVSGCHWSGYDPTKSYEYTEGGEGFTNWTGSGILVIAPNSALEISDNEVQSCDVGLDIEAGPDTSIEDNDVHDNSYGFVSWNADPTLSFNNIYQNALGGVYRTSLGSLEGTLDAINNWWGNASGPIPTGTYDSYGDKVSANVEYEPWLLEEVDIEDPAPTIYDKTLALKDGWTLISVDKAVAEPIWVGTNPLVVEQEATTMALKYTPTGGFVSEVTPTDLQPLTAIYVLTKGGGGVGFNYAGDGDPAFYSKDLEAGWNLIGIPDMEASTRAILSPLRYVTVGTQQGVGLTTLVSQGDYNQFSESFYQATLTDGDWDVLETLNPYDGYWANMEGADTFEVPIP